MARSLFIFITTTILSFSCTTEKETNIQSNGLDLRDMDTTIRPQDDFYQYANGGWLRRTTIPADKGRWGNFSALSEFNNNIMLEILKEVIANDEYTDGTDQRKAADFYSIGMDSLLAERIGTEVLAPVFNKITNIKSNVQLLEYLVEQELEGGGAFFNFFVIPDFKNSERMAPYLGSGGLGLPERDYYLKNDEKSKETRTKYLSHIVSMFQLTGETPELARIQADEIMKIETRLAKATLTKEESRNLSGLYNQKSIADLQQIAPSIDWILYFDGFGVARDSIIVTEPAFIEECQRIFAGGNWNSIQYYLKWKALDGASPFLNHAIVHEDFEFTGKYLRGIEQMSPRWKRVLAVTDDYLGEAIGQLYVEKTFPPEAKKKGIEMVDNIKLAMADRIKQLNRMSDSTKVMVLSKLATFNVKIGYPDKWKSYSGLVVEKSSYYQNVVNASQFQARQEINKLEKPVDRSEWDETPQTVNAYNDLLFNEIVFPAGILQPPFYNYEADEAVNYGGIGAVIGHEILHGFDDQGSQFDAKGNLVNWWNEADFTRFKDKGKALVDQFNSYEPLPEVMVQGQFTLGENIGDLGGLNIAYEGLQRFLRENGKRQLIDGFTPEQRFFLSWATIWRSKYKDETLREAVNTDMHAPGMYRVNGPISNMDQFYDAFDLKPGDKLYRDPDDRVVIW